MGLHSSVGRAPGLNQRGKGAAKAKHTRNTSVSNRPDIYRFYLTDERGFIGAVVFKAPILKLTVQTDQN